MASSVDQTRRTATYAPPPQPPTPPAAALAPPPNRASPSTRPTAPGTSPSRVQSTSPPAAGAATSWDSRDEDGLCTTLYTRLLRIHRRRDADSSPSDESDSDGGHSTRRPRRGGTVSNRTRRPRRTVPTMNHTATPTSSSMFSSAASPTAATGTGIGHYGDAAPQNIAAGTADDAVTTATPVAHALDLSQRASPDAAAGAGPPRDDDGGATTGSTAGLHVREPCPRIPDTVVFIRNFPQGWYTYDSRESELVKRSGKCLDIHQILDSFREVHPDAGGICAQWVSDEFVSVGRPKRPSRPSRQQQQQGSTTRAASDHMAHIATADDGGAAGGAMSTDPPADAPPSAWNSLRRAERRHASGGGPASLGSSMVDMNDTVRSNDLNGLRLPVAASTPPLSHLWPPQHNSNTDNGGVFIADAVSEDGAARRDDAGSRLQGRSVPTPPPPPRYASPSRASSPNPTQRESSNGAAYSPPPVHPIVPQQQRRTTIAYLTPADLEDLLHNRGAFAKYSMGGASRNPNGAPTQGGYGSHGGKTGILQRFVVPRSSRNDAVHVVWSPGFVGVYRMANRAELLNTTLSPNARGGTFDAPPHGAIDAHVTAEVRRQATDVVARAARRLARDGDKVSRVAAFLKQDDRGRLWLLHVTSLRIVSGLAKLKRTERVTPLDLVTSLAPPPTPPDLSVYATTQSRETHLIDENGLLSAAIPRHVVRAIEAGVPHYPHELMDDMWRRVERRNQQHLLLLTSSGAHHASSPSPPLGSASRAGRSASSPTSSPSSSSLPRRDHATTTAAAAATSLSPSPPAARSREMAGPIASAERIQPNTTGPYSILPPGAALRIAGLRVGRAAAEPTRDTTTSLDDSDVAALAKRGGALGGAISVLSCFAPAGLTRGTSVPVGSSSAALSRRAAQHSPPRPMQHPAVSTTSRSSAAATAVDASDGVGGTGLPTSSGGGARRTSPHRHSSLSALAASFRRTSSNASTAAAQGPPGAFGATSRPSRRQPSVAPPPAPAPLARPLSMIVRRPRPADAAPAANPNSNNNRSGGGGTHNRTARLGSHRRSSDITAPADLRGAAAVTPADSDSHTPPPPPPVLGGPRDGDDRDPSPPMGAAFDVCAVESEVTTSISSPTAGAIAPCIDLDADEKGYRQYSAQLMSLVPIKP